MADYQDIVCLEGTANRMVVVDISPGVDLLTGVLDACRKHNIKTGIICYCIGSLKYATIETLVAAEGSKTGASFGQELSFPGPIQLLSGQGIVGLDENDELFAHMHIVFVDGGQGKIYGGHVIEGKNPAINRLEFGIITTEDLIVSTELDERTGLLHLVPKKGM
ncbi:DNA-binding protein [Eubacteriales bacterium OttesenSCG-928-N14]|nr:DNA-binding protein [Eubacteriales bacterium OttesenSCG-928-N14]